MYVPKVLVPKPQHVLQVESSSEASKVPIVASGVFEETIDLNAPSF
jgi:hypothetical protein